MIAAATERLRLGPLVTPLARRRPVKVARETATLDRLSAGRLTLGVGLGSDEFASEYSITGEELDDRRRARMLDESLEILAAAWSGEPVRHRGEHYTVDGMRVPAAAGSTARRADLGCGGAHGKVLATPPGGPASGLLPDPRLEHPEQLLGQVVGNISPALRTQAGRNAAELYDLVVALAPGRDPRPYAAAGATWWLVEFPWDPVSVDQIRGVIQEGPAPGNGGWRA